MRGIRTGITTALFVAGLANPAHAHGGGGSEHGGSVSPRAERQIEQLRHVTAPYRHGPDGPWTTEVVDVNGISCIEDPEGTGGMGIHYVDPTNLGDGRISRLKPEALIYEPKSDGRLRLVATEYLVLADVWDSRHSRPPRLYGHTFERVEAGNRYGLPAFYELHVWHEKTNRLGTFNDWNPRVHCGSSVGMSRSKGG